MLSLNRYNLKETTKVRYLPVVKDFIENLEKWDGEDYFEKDFSDTELNPYTLGMILEELGYERVNQDDNGWQMDFWITYEKEGYKSISLEGTGITFELKLSEIE